MRKFNQTLSTLLTRLARDEQGATAIEYGLIATFCGVALILSMQSLGNALGNTFTTVSGKMANANNTASA